MNPLPVLPRTEDDQPYPSSDGEPMAETGIHARDMALSALVNADQAHAREMDARSREVQTRERLEALQNQYQQLLAELDKLRQSEGGSS